MSKHRSVMKETFYAHRLFLFDLDGTLYLGRKLLPGALKLVERLRALDKRLLFFTNNSSRNERDYVQKLKQFGFKVSIDEIVMSTHSLIAFLQKRRLRRIFLLGTLAMKAMVRSAKIEITDKKPQVVAIGFDKTLTYEKIWRASQLISKGTPWIVTHPDYYCPTDEGPEPDCGAIAEMLRLTTGVSPIVTLGKPHPLMLEEAIKRHPDVEKQDIVLIGDRLMTDIAMARAGKISSVLVFSGETTQVIARQSSIKPTFAINSVADLL